MRNETLAVPVVNAVPSSLQAIIKDSVWTAGAAHFNPKAWAESAVKICVSLPIGILACPVEYPDKSPFVVVGGAISVGVSQDKPVASEDFAVNTFPFDPTPSLIIVVEKVTKSPFVVKTSAALVAAFFNVLRNFEPPISNYHLWIIQVFFSLTNLLIVWNIGF